MTWTQRLTNYFATSLQRKLILVMTLVVTLAMLAFGVFLVNNQLQDATTELEGRATRTVDLLSQTAALPLWNVDITSLQAQINAVMADREVNAVRVIETGKTKPIVESAPRETPAIAPITRKAQIIFLQGEEKRILGTVEIDYTRKYLNDSLAETGGLIAFIILILILLQVIGIYLLIGRLVTSPLREITTLTSRVASGDLTGHVKLASRDEMNILATAFNSTTSQLRQTLEGLEQRVKERTADLEASNLLTKKNAQAIQAVSDISRIMASIQSINELLPTIVNSISERLGYYHAAIYLLNETGDYAVLNAASSQGGQLMFENQYSRLRVEPSSLVGFAASRGQSRVARDVDQDATYLAVPDLPDTKSEAVLPLKAGAQIIGVLDVQSTQPDAFSEQDVNVLNTLASQVAISIQNARSFGETRRALADAEKVYQQFVQQGWSRISRETPNLGYRYSQDGLTPLKIAGEPSKKTEAQPVPIDQKDQAIVLIPIKLRGQTIGTLRVRPTELSRAWDDDEMALIQATAERAALALETARLLEDSQRRASRERAIGEISSRISEKSDIDAILRSTVEELGKKLADATVAIQIGRNE